MNNVIVIGMGEVGKHLSTVLAGEGHNVTIIDNHSEALAKAEERMDVMALHGHGCSPKVLQAANVHQADLLVAATSDDEVNMLASLTAKQLGARKAIARVSGSDYLEGNRGVYYDYLGIDLLLAPEILTAIEINRLVRSMGAITVQTFADNRVEVIQFPITANLKIINKLLKDVSLPEDCLIVGILRNDELIIPGGNDMILPDDDVFVIGKTESMPRIERIFGASRRGEVRRLVIVGGGQIGASIARSLENEPIEIKLIDHNRERCEELAATLGKNVRIINGDGTNLDLLREYDIDVCDVFVAASSYDEVNLMSGLLARQLGAKKTIARVNRPDYVPIYEQLGIDATISPRLLAANHILKYVREGEVISMSIIADGKGEVLEFLVPANSKLANSPLRHINFPRGAVIGVIAGADGVFVPDGNDVIKPSHSIVIFTTPEVRPSIEKLFKKKAFSL
ncbi:MAG: Trk system potassium transporter TrkA [Gemmatimonadetes bacterium]|nr:MAG: Trk system potassium transporter TrkA [Gemmatimonadota bacterium]